MGIDKEQDPREQYANLKAPDNSDSVREEELGERKKLEQKFNQYARSDSGRVYVQDIYSEHKSQKGLSSKLVWQAGLEQAKKILHMVEGLANPKRTENPDIKVEKEAMTTLEVLQTETQLSRNESDWKVKDQSLQKMDQTLADFARKRIEDFFSAIDQRQKLAGRNLDKETMGRLKRAVTNMENFFKGPEDYFGENYSRINRSDNDYMKFYNFLRKYPAAEMGRILFAIESNLTSTPFLEMEFDPMTPLSEIVRKHESKESK